MAVFLSLLAVLVLGIGAYWGASSGMQSVFGVYVPYVAVAVFICGFIWRIVDWARTPVPFSIPTTGAQEKSLDWIKYNPIDNPHNKGWTVVRMITEVCFFRSLFRNVGVSIHQTSDGPRVAYSSAKWLWLFALLFHYSFLVIFIRHFRFFVEPVPMLVSITEFFDGIMQMGVPRFYQSDLIIVAALAFLLLRRFFNCKVRYISLAQDYFPLFLLLGIVCTGIWMRYIGKTDIDSVKVMTMGLIGLSPTIKPDVAPIFYSHLFLVSCLLIYFPFSKLMHMGGIFLSPTRNLPNNSREKHYNNPWNPPKVYHTYEAYEDDFREHMIEAGLPVDKMPDGSQSSSDAAAE